MSTLKGAILGSVVTAAMLSAAYADRDLAINQEGQMVMFSGSGEMAMGKMKSLEPFKNAKPLLGGLVVFNHDGRLYAADDSENAMFNRRTDLGEM